MEIDKFKIIIITKPTFFEGEVEKIIEFLKLSTADYVHIRKPDAQFKEVEDFLRKIPEKLHSRLVLHDYFELAKKYQLYGVHLNSRNPSPPSDWNGSVSKSCHSISEAIEWGSRVNYVSLSPIFDSISKQGYKSKFKKSELEELLKDKHLACRIYALGGVTFERLGEVRTIGFGGAMILGDAWR